MSKKTNLIKRITSCSIVGAMAVSTASAATTGNFSDISNLSATSQQAINYLLQKNIISGEGAGLFDPSGSLTRAEFAKIVVSSLGLNVNTNTSTSVYFSDVTGWAAGYVDAAKQSGLINGVGDGEFDPNGIVTREQAAVILVNALKTKQNIDATAPLTFTDVTDQWAENYVALAKEYNLINGIGDNKFAPLSNATREQAALLAYNLIQAINNSQQPPATTTPTVTAVSFVNNNTNTAVVYGKATNADSVKISTDGGAWVPVTLLSNGTYSYTTGLLALGNHTIGVEAISGTTASAPVYVTASVGNTTATGTTTTPVVTPIMYNADVQSIVASDAYHIVVTYSRAMDVTTATSKSMYTLSNGLQLSSSILPTISSDDRTVTLTLSAPVQNNTYFTVDLNQNILDSSGNPLSTTNDYVAPIYWNDSQALTVTGVTNVYAGSVKVTFNKPLGSKPTVVMNGQPVTVDGYTLGNNYVIISKTNIPSSITPGTSVNLIVSNATDQSVPPNELTLYQSTFYYSAYAQAPVLSQITANDEKTVTMTFNEPLYGAITNGSTNNVSAAFNLTITQNGTTVIPNNVTTTDGQTFTVTLPDIYQTFNTTSVPLQFAVSNFKDAGNDLGAATQQTAYLYEDQTAPTLIGTRYTTDNKIVLTFSKKLTQNESALETGLTITNNANGMTTAVSGKLVGQPYGNTITLDNSASGLNMAPGTYTFSFAKGTVTDTSFKANPNAVFSTQVTVPSSQGTTGTAVSVTSTAHNVYQVTFSSPVNYASVSSLYNYQLSGSFLNAYNGSLPAGTTVLLDSNGTTATITLPSNTINATGSEVLTISNIQNVNNSIVPTTQNLVKLYDNTQPTLTGGSVDASGNLILNFSEDIDGMQDETSAPATTPSRSDFIITVNGNPISATSITVGKGTNEEQIKLTSTDANFLSGPVVVTTASSATGADADGNVIKAGTTYTIN